MITMGKFLAHATHIVKPLFGNSKEKAEMANFVITYDLNGPFPSHKQMDEHLARLTAKRGRVLETVWWVEYHGTAVQLRDQVASILGKEDLLLVIEAASAAWTKLLVPGDAFKQAFEKAA